MNVGEIMTSPAYFVSPEDSLAHARRLFLKHKISTMPVVKGAKIIGILNAKNIAKTFYEKREPIEDVLVREAMEKKAFTVKPDTSIEDVASILLKTPSVIVFGNEFLGIVTKTDIVRYFSQNYSGMVQVHEIMQKNVKTIKPSNTIFQAAKQMQTFGIGRLLVVDRDLKGIISARDIALASYGLRPDKLVFYRQKSWKKERAVHYFPLIVEDIMREDVITMPSKSDAASAARFMLSKNIGSVIIVDNNKLRGILTKTDITRYLASKK